MHGFERCQARRSDNETPRAPRSYKRSITRVRWSAVRRESRCEGGPDTRTLTDRTSIRGSNPIAAPRVRPQRSNRKRPPQRCTPADPYSGGPVGRDDGIRDSHPPASLENVALRCKRTARQQRNAQSPTWGLNRCRSVALQLLLEVTLQGISTAEGFIVGVCDRLRGLG